MDEKTLQEWKKKIQRILNKRKWDAKEWHRAINLNQWILEGLMNDEFTIDEDMIKNIYEMTLESSKKKMLRFSKPVVISSWTHKGGTGKSTLAINLSHELSSRGYNVLAIDTDGQSDMTSVLFPDYLDYPDKNFYEAFVMHYDIKDGGYIFHTPYDNLDIIAGSGQLEDLENILAPMREEQRSSIFDMCLKKIMEENYYDFIIIDRDKGAGLFNKAILSKTDFVISPVECAMFSIKSIPPVIENINIIKKYNPSLELLGIVLNKVDLRKKVALAEAQALIEEIAPGMLFNTYIKNESNIEKSQKEHMPLGEYLKSSTANRQMIKLTDEILRCIKKGNGVN